MLVIKGISNGTFIQDQQGYYSSFQSLILFFIHLRKNWKDIDNGCISNALAVGLLVLSSLFSKHHRTYIGQYMNL